MSQSLRGTPWQIHTWQIHMRKTKPPVRPTAEEVDRRNVEKVAASAELAMYVRKKRKK